MARTQATILTSIWSDPDWLDLSADAQRVYLLLLTQPKLTLAGSLDLMEARWGRLSADGASVSGGITELVETTFVVAHHDELVIRTFVANDLGRGTVNGNLVKGMWSAWRAISSPLLRKVVVDQMPQQVYGRAGVDVPDEAQRLRAETPLDLPLHPRSEPRFQPQSQPQSEPRPEPSVICSLSSADCSSTKSQDYSQPATPAEPTAADQQKQLKTAALVSRTIEPPAGANPDAYAAGIAREINTGPDPTRRDEIARRLTAGDTPEQIAATWTEANDRPTVSPEATQEAAERARNLERATADRLARQRAEKPVADPHQAITEARTRIGATP